MFLPGTCAGFLFLVPPPSAWAASAHRGRPNSVVESRHPRYCRNWTRYELLAVTWILVRRPRPLHSSDFLIDLVTEGREECSD